MRLHSAGSQLLAALLPLLVGLLLLVAFLQYRWIGQLSDGERDRMRSSLLAGMVRFRQDFDGELTRAAMAYRMGPPPAFERTLHDYAERFDRWRDENPHALLLRNLYAIEGDGRVLLLDQDSLRWKPVDWPPALAPLRPRLESPARRPSRLGPPFRIGVAEDIPALILPRYSGFLILELDLPYIQTDFLPDLARRHLFTFTHHLQVVTKTTPPKVIYQSDPATDFSSPDATISLFDILSPGLPLQRPDLRQGGLWLLHAKHRSGSLDVAIERARRRNLSISFAVLLLMAMAMGLLVVSTRRAQRLARLQMEFVAGVSHEIRTPLAVISSAADNLADGLVTTPEQAQRYGAAIRKEGRRLADMVQQVLTFAGAESGRLNLQLEPVPLSAVVERALAACDAAAREAGCRLEVDIQPDLPPILADPTALSHAVQNLLLNACKYGSDGHWVGVRTRLLADSIELSIEDRGPGIDPADLPHIFEPFYRGRRAIASQIRGTGLGLSLVQRIMEAHGGAVTVRSAPGQGACFTMTLPLAPTHEATPALG